MNISEIDLVLGLLEECSWIETKHIENAQIEIREFVRKNKDDLASLLRNELVLKYSELGELQSIDSDKFLKLRRLLLLFYLERVNLS